MTLTSLPLCVLQAEEFDNGLHEDIDMDTLNLLPDNDVFVAYAWRWLDIAETSLDEHDNVGSSESLELTATSDTEEEDEPDQFAEGFITHTVTFKCIGASRDDDHQVALQAASRILKGGQDVPIRLEPEPDNPIDPNAIAFLCLIDRKWNRVGYVVKEALEDVRGAMEGDNILSVKFAWVKFLLCWSQCGPGFYTGINITRKGEWSKAVTYSASTK